MVLIAMLLALLAALAIDWLAHRANLTPPGFVIREGDEADAWQFMLRRTLAIIVLTLILWVGVFGPLATLGTATGTDLSGVGIWALFLLHILFAISLVAWYFLGFLGFSGRSSFSWKRQFGLETPNLWREIGIGLVAGAGAWAAVLAVLILVGIIIVAVGGDEAMPQEPSPLIPWIAGLPIVVRLAVSASAGFFEELFFRGFLQPRIGIALSTAFFVLAHANYEQPLMLVGIGLLSVIYGLLVRWRQNIWPAIVAHALFDAVQLLVVVPIALRFLEQADGGSWLPVALAPLSIWWRVLC